MAKNRGESLPAEPSVERKVLIDVMLYLDAQGAIKADAAEVNSKYSVDATGNIKGVFRQCGWIRWTTSEGALCVFMKGGARAGGGDPLDGKAFFGAPDAQGLATVIAKIKKIGDEDYGVAILKPDATGVWVDPRISIQDDRG